MSVGAVVRGGRSPFARTLDAEMTVHGETPASLSLLDGAPAKLTLQRWRRGTAHPTFKSSLAFIARLEARWGLPAGSLTTHLRPSPPMRASRHWPRRLNTGLADIPLPVLAWHIPHDFACRPLPERQAIDAWLEATFLGPPDAYAWWRANGERPFAFVFPLPRSPDVPGIFTRSRRSPPVPHRLVEQWLDLHAFASTPLLPPGRQRDRQLSLRTLRIWAGYSGCVFGFLAMTPRAGRHGLGLDPETFSFGHLVFPSVWRAYVEARTKARGTGSRTELNLLLSGMSLLRKGTGWLRQSMALAADLQPLPGLVSPEEIRRVQHDWTAACDRCVAELSAMASDLRRMIGIQRPLHASVEVVLRHPRPLALYHTIAEEVLAQSSHDVGRPRARARRLQFHLMLRLALHTGFRQGMLRRLLVCPPGTATRPLEALHRTRRGALFWHDVRERWEIVAPATAFKNADSAVFHTGPHRMALPNADGLYAHLAAFLAESRPLLLAGRTDQGGLFVNPNPAAALELSTEGFQSIWRRGISLYGVWNPWTERGAIEGLRPHGPHAIRSIIATHILKQTGSVDLASFALQNRPRSIEVYYAHLHQAERSQLVSQALNDVWASSDNPQSTGHASGHRRTPRRLDHRIRRTPEAED